MKKLAVLLLATVLLAVSLAGCGPQKLKITEEEAFEVLSELVPKSYAINEAFFGKGLKPSEDVTSDTTKYVAVDLQNSAYTSINHMKLEAEKVYSGNYLDSIYVIMFVGTQSSESDGLLDNDTSPRYKEIQGQLCIDVAYTPHDILGMLTVTEVVKIAERTTTYVAIDAKCTDEDGNEIEKRFYLTKQDGQWLLDGPTY